METYSAVPFSYGIFCSLEKPFSVFRRVRQAHRLLSFGNKSLPGANIFPISAHFSPVPASSRKASLATAASDLELAEGPWKASCACGSRILPCKMRLASWYLLLHHRGLMSVSQKGWGLSSAEEYFLSTSNTQGSVLSTENKKTRRRR